MPTTNASATLATGTGAARTPGPKVSPAAANAAGTGAARAPGHITSPTPATATGAGAVRAATTTPYTYPSYAFTPPSWDQIPPVADDTPPLAARLFRRMSARPMGRNVWVLPDGTHTFAEPWPLIEDTGATRAGLFPATNPTPGSSWSNRQQVTYKRVYWGGRSYVLSTGDAADVDEIVALSAFLTAEGYTYTDWIVAR